MAQKNIPNINTAINPDRCPLIYYPIDDNDCESVSFYETKPPPAEAGGFGMAAEAA